MKNTKILGQNSNLKTLETAVVQDLPTLLIGETGTGKTEMIKSLAENSGKTLIRYNTNGETTTDEMVGRYELIDNRTVWVDGVVVEAMKNGHWLLIDEVNLALPEVIMVLQALLDDSKEIRIAQHHGEVIKPAPGFRFFASMNPTEGYSGTKPLNRAFLSRFPIVITVDYPEREDEVKILKSHGLKDEEAQTIMDIAIVTRRFKKNGQINYQISTRELIQYATLRQFINDPEECIRLAITNKAQNEDKQVIRQIVADILADYKEIKDKGLVPNIKILKEKLQEIELKKREVELERERIKEEVARELLETINKDDKKEEAPF